MLRVLSEYYPTLAGFIIALLLIFWPPPKRSAEEQCRQARLAELASGAEEKYLEERRALEAYGPKSGGPFRMWGVLILILLGAQLVIQISN